MEGRVFFKVYGYDSLFHFIFGMNDVYDRNNKTLEQAIDQIDSICENVVKDEKTVYFYKV